MSNTVDKFDNTYEVFKSLVKYFLIFVVINNLLWVSVFGFYIYKSYTSEIATVTMDQDGNNNHQELINGKDKDKD